MYKNFNLTESEKEEILKKHKSYGYGKPLNEEYNDGEEMDEPNTDGETPQNLKLESGVYVEAQNFILFVTGDDGGEAWVEVSVNHGELKSAKVSHNETDFNEREIMALVKQKINEGMFEKFPTLITWDMESGNCSTNN